MAAAQNERYPKVHRALTFRLQGRLLCNSYTPPHFMKVDAMAVTLGLLGASGCNLVGHQWCRAGSQVRRPASCLVQQVRLSGWYLQLREWGLSPLLRDPGGFDFSAIGD